MSGDVYMRKHERSDPIPDHASAASRGYARATKKCARARSSDAAAKSFHISSLKNSSHTQHAKCMRSPCVVLRYAACCHLGAAATRLTKLAHEFWKPFIAQSARFQDALPLRHRHFRILFVDPTWFQPATSARTGPARGRKSGLPWQQPQGCLPLADTFRGGATLMAVFFCC